MARSLLDPFGNSLLIWSSTSSMVTLERPHDRNRREPTRIGGIRTRLIVITNPFDLLALMGKRNLKLYLNNGSGSPLASRTSCLKNIEGKRALE
jgi:hypothetical protein